MHASEFMLSRLLSSVSRGERRNLRFQAFPSGSCVGRPGQFFKMHHAPCQTKGCCVLAVCHPVVPVLGGHALLVNLAESRQDGSMRPSTVFVYLNGGLLKHPWKKLPGSHEGTLSFRQIGWGFESFGCVFAFPLFHATPPPCRLNAGACADRSEMDLTSDQTLKSCAKDVSEAVTQQGSSRNPTIRPSQPL